MFTLFKKKVQFESKSDQISEISYHPLARKFISGDDCDELPNSVGEFGKTPTNPIPVNGPVGEIKYLNRLRLNGRPIFFHRLTSTKISSSDEAVDIYEVCDSDGENWDILYFHMYHPRRSEKLPTGYEFSDFHKLFSVLSIGLGTTDFQPSFPFYLEKHLDEQHGEEYSLSKTYAQLFKNDKNYYRPINHLSNLLQVNNVGSFIQNVFTFISIKYPSTYISNLFYNSNSNINIAALFIAQNMESKAEEYSLSIAELFFRSKEEYILELICETLRIIFPSVKTTFPKFVEGLFDTSNTEKYNYAVYFLALSGPVGIPYIFPLLKHENPEIVSIATEMLKDIREKVLVK